MTNVDAAVGKLNHVLRGAAKRSLDSIGDSLDPNEPVLRLAAGVRPSGISNIRVLMLLTDRKVMVLRDGVIRSSQEVIPLDLMTGAAVGKGIIWARIKTTGAQSNEVIKRVNKADAAAFVNELRSLLASRGRVSDRAASTRGGVAEELSRLATLGDQGVLTEAEFNAQKANLLG